MEVLVPNVEAGLDEASPLEEQLNGERELLVEVVSKSMGSKPSSLAILKISKWVAFT